MRTLLAILSFGTLRSISMVLAVTQADMIFTSKASTSANLRDLFFPKDYNLHKSEGSELFLFLFQLLICMFLCW